jgi:hypothetical protein
MTRGFSFSQFRVAAQALRDSAAHDLRRSCSVSAHRVRRGERLNAFPRQADLHVQRILCEFLGNPGFQSRIAFAGW